MIKSLAFFLMFFIGLNVFATEVFYTATAKTKDNKVSYQERHKAHFDSGAIKTTRTEYLNAEGKLIAELSSDFTGSVTVPNYEFKDLRDGSSHGIVTQDNNYTVWRQEKGKEREQKVYPKTNFDNNALVVGCQGLHYYLVDNLSKLRAEKRIPIKYLIPGKLDYYSFTLALDKEDQDYVYLQITIDSIFLKLFASALDLKYRKSDMKLVEYKGLSNLADESGSIQKVTINYNY